MQKLQVQVMRSQKFEVGAYYLGLCFQYQGKDEAIPQVGQVGGPGVPDLVADQADDAEEAEGGVHHRPRRSASSTRASILKQHRQEFEITTVNPSSAPIPDDVDALIVAGPKQPFDDKGRNEIDAFLMKGKGAIFLVDGMAMQAPRGSMPPEMMGA